MSEQQKMARRWGFTPTLADPNKQAGRLAEIGFILAVPDGTGGFSLVTDLRRRPVEMKKNDLKAFKNSPVWIYSNPQFLTPLAKEMGLSIVPRFIVMFLPEDRVEKLAATEVEYAKAHGRDLAKIRMTYFDFILQNGAYEPVVLRQD